MRGRLSSICFCLLFTAAIVETSQAASLQQQRQYYDEAKRALAKGDSGPYRRHASALRDYPLEPYLAYDELTARLKTASNDEVEKFLAEHGDLPQASWMKLRWLRLLAARGDWRPFVAHYDPAMNFAELDCLFGQYQLSSGQTKQGYETAERLWLVGKSQHNACDALFDRWRDAGQLSEDLVWQRTKLAVESGNYGLANFLVKSLPTMKSQGELLVEVAQKPQMLGQTDRFMSPTPAMGDIVSIGLRRLARKDPEKALGLLDSYARRLSFSTDEKVAIARQIGLTLAKRFDARALTVMAEYDPELRDDTVSEWRARLLLRLGRWDDAHALIQRFTGELASSNRWRYWNARSLELAQPNDKQAIPLYQPVASERDFYGFLSADRIQAPYKLNHQPLALDPKLMQKVRNTAGIRRAMEFHARGEIVNGRREWYHVSRLFSRDELVAQARLAYDMEWYFPAIRTISQAKYWDDLDIRFPMAYRSSLVNAAKAREIHPSWVFAITRQESAFMADARSHVGATGLMQLMPATAKETARRFDIPLSSHQQVLNPNTNIQLGAAYLSQIYGQFKGNRVLASAAYNAGPGRVRQWLRDAEHLPFDVWVENIPFDETRQYVQNVLTYSVIYGQKLNAPQPLVEWHERYFESQ
ncbi:transglycosylase SLT domain-containing protein [Pseudomonas sp. MTM4]|uniref:transglycosylase SLT domain-containing protein n=1 Tax=unclassified Pseudomonas TaxID=196821 RepID=UPI0018D24D8C|nr:MULTISPECIES: transglycosylase SLT domain-containing protein [unclassified Pseudomonas]MBC8650996.1 transglycosylase SLT domain-containing protein [Pseudomonas sp. MT4]QXY91061.1 transglycosylase SLT domain-containing protein [Pseudomonas sp. MTM4]